MQGDAAIGRELLCGSWLARAANGVVCKIAGVLLDGERPAEAGDTLWQGDKQVGVITCAMYSRLSKRSMAIARLSVDCATPGTPLQVRGSLNASAASHALPFDDPQKTKRTAKG